MSGFSTDEARAILNHEFRTATHAKRSIIYWALFDDDPTDANITSEELPIGTNGYARVPVNVADASFSAPTTIGGVEVIANNGNVTFGIPTGDWNAGVPIKYAGAYSAATGGQLIGSGPLATPRAVLSTDNAPTFGPGALQISLG